MSSVAGSVTLLFTDLVTSAELLQQVDDEQEELLDGGRDVVHFEVVPAADDGAPPPALR